MRRGLAECAPGRHACVAALPGRALPPPARLSRCARGLPGACRVLGRPRPDLGPRNARRLGQPARAEPTATQERPQAKWSEGFRLSVGDLADICRRAGAETANAGESRAEHSAAAVAAGVGSCTREGLSDDEAGLERRRAAFGSNRLPERKEVSLVELAVAALSDATVLTLLAAGTASLVLNLALGDGSEWVEGAAILAAVAVVVLVTAGNDFQKERQFRELSSLAEYSEVTVLRGGRSRQISSADLVVGDVLLFGYGDVLSVDGLLIEASDVRVDESALTGESEDVAKDAARAPLLQSGSRVLQGAGRLLVAAVGLNSQQGQIFGSLASPASGLRETTALTRKLDELAGQIGRFGLAAALLSFGATAGRFTLDNVVTGGGWQAAFVTDYLHFFVTAVTILVVAVPEGLPLAVTLALAFSVRRMLADNNLVRRLSAAEAMGCATTICTDKTGTLTKNEMRVVKAWVAGCKLDAGGAASAELQPAARQAVVEAILLNCSASVEPDASTGELVRTGNRTECALLEWAQGLGGDRAAAEARWERRTVAPFSSERKRMTSVAAPREAGGGSNGAGGGAGEGLVVLSKGAAELMLPLCTRMLRPDGSTAELPQAQAAAALEAAQRGGQRMLLVASRPLGRVANGGQLHPRELERELTLLAIVGIADPLRPEAVEAVAQFSRAGITTRMLTGDNKLTAARIAAECGILPGGSGQAAGGDSLFQGRPGEVLEGGEWRARVTNPDGSVRQAEFDASWATLRVLARCSPADKLTIVRGLQNNPQEVVCMTGDGTNDAPALKAADIGFAMNGGTAVAKEAADILLLDSNLLSVVKAVAWGRNVYAGITKFLQFQLVVNLVAVATASVGAVWATGSPLTAVQMLWVNLIMDSLASLALATQPPSDALLDRPPFSSTAPLLTPVVLKGIVGQCAFQLGVMYALVFHGDALFRLPADSPPELHGSLVFNTFVLMQLVNQVNARCINDEPNALAGFFDNRLFLGILGGELALQVVIVQFGGAAFSTAPLDGPQWAACAGIASLGFAVRAALLLVPPKPQGARVPGEAARKAE